MADPIKNTSDTGTPQTTQGAGGTSGTTGAKGTDKSGAQSGTAARTAREQSPGWGRESGQSSFINNAERAAQRGSEVMDQAREGLDDAYNRANEMYERASRSVAEGWDSAVDYGRKNPGTATLIAFGVGVGFGLLIANGMSSRSRTQRLVPPVMNALSEIASELFR